MIDCCGGPALPSEDPLLGSSPLGPRRALVGAQTGAERRRRGRQAPAS